MSWWRSNRFWLPAVPVALVAMLAGSAYHVKTFYYDSGLHHPMATSAPGSFVSVVDSYTDTEGKTARRFRVRLAGVSRVDQVRDNLGDPVDLPADTDAYRVHLDFTASPSVAMRGCFVALVDSGGNRYGGGFSDLLGQSNLCVPEGQEGPETAQVPGEKRGRVPEGADRPEGWSVSPVVLVRHGVRITGARLWFLQPDYVVLPLS